MNEETVAEYAKIMKGEQYADFIKTLLCEIYTEVNLLNQKVKELQKENEIWRLKNS